VELEAKTLALLERLAQAERALLTRKAYALGLSATQAQILLLLEGQSMAAGALAEALRLTSPTITDALNALKAKGLAEEGPDPSDRRRKRLALTPKGEGLAQGLKAYQAPLRGALLEVPDPEGLWEGLLHLASSLVRLGIMAETGLCLTCRYLRREGGYSCALLGIPLVLKELRLACPDHVPA
jgi:DNA-binding MarR family transcriptional regulator